MITSTAVTLVAIPASYEILDEPRPKLLQLGARLFPGRRLSPTQHVLPEEGR